MPSNKNTEELVLRAAISLCVEELDQRSPDWREGLADKARFAAHDGVARFGEIERVNDQSEMEKIAKMIRNVLYRVTGRTNLAKGTPPCIP